MHLDGGKACALMCAVLIHISPKIDLFCPLCCFDVQETFMAECPLQMPFLLHRYTCIHVSGFAGSLC